MLIEQAILLEGDNRPAILDLGLVRDQFECRQLPGGVFFLPPDGRGDVVDLRQIVGRSKPAKIDTCG
jgi:hypothetical protein